MLAAADRDAAALTAAARQAFIDAHLATIAAPLAARLDGAGGSTTRSETAAAAAAPTKIEGAARYQGL